MLTQYNQRLAHLKELPMSDNVIDLSKLIKMPGGGTHDIYKINNDPTFLLKVIRDSVGKEREDLENTLVDLTNKYQKLYHVFGEDNCLIESRCINPVKISENELPKNAIISLVGYDHCFGSNDKFGFNAEVVELQESNLQENSQDYHAMNHFLLGKDPQGAAFDSEGFFKFHGSFRSIFQLLDEDVSLKRSMQDFLEKFKQYYHQTGQLMDFNGLNNVLFYKEGDAWRYKVGSVIKVETKEKTNRLLNEIDSNPSVVNDRENWTHIFFVPSWLRVLNATAAKLNMDRIVDDITLTQKDSENLSRIYETQPLSKRALALAEANKFEKALDFFQTFAKTEVDHDTFTRDMLGTWYWRYLQQQKDKSPPTEEIQAYLNLLSDPRNDFPDTRKEEIKSAMEGLQRIMTLSENRAYLPGFGSTSQQQHPTQEGDRRVVSRVGNKPW